MKQILGKRDSWRGMKVISQDEYADLIDVHMKLFHGVALTEENELSYMLDCFNSTTACMGTKFHLERCYCKTHDEFDHLVVIKDDWYTEVN